MKRAEIQLFLNSLSENFVRGVRSDFSKRFKYPVAHYVPNHVIVFSCPAVLQEKFDAYCAFLRARGVERQHASKFNVIDATPDRALVDVEWSYFDTNGHVLSTSKVQYVLCRGCAMGDLLIELVDYSVLAFPAYLEQTSSSNAS